MYKNILIFLFLSHETYLISSEQDPLNFNLDHDIDVMDIDTEKLSLLLQNEIDQIITDEHAPQSQSSIQTQPLEDKSSHGKFFICSICNNVFTQQYNLRTHHKSVHLKNKKHSCTLCKKKFYKKNDLTRHVQTHTGEKPFKCIECYKSFSLKGNLKKHRITHASKKLFVCTDLMSLHKEQ